MSEQIARRFIDALGRLESHGEIEALVDGFAESYDVGNVLAPEQFHGREGARKFWTEYRDAFADVRSTFRNVVAADGRAALEWTTEGTGRAGEPFRYDGVSILESADGAITRFRAYFDPAALGRQLHGSERG